VERIADASGEATRSGGVLPDDLPRDVAFWPIAADPERPLSGRQWVQNGHQPATAEQLRFYEYTP